MSLKIRNIAPLLMALMLLPAIRGAAEDQQRRVLFIRAELENEKFSVTDEALDSVLSRAALYFNDQLSDCGLHFSFETGPSVAISGSYNQENAYLAIIEACRQADAQTDFSLYDCDGDGTADCIGVIFSGEWLWPQQHSLSAEGLSLKLDGTAIDSYLILGEYTEGQLLGMGRVCHEYGHALGLVDLYDTDGEGSGGTSKGLWGSISLMDKGDRNETPPGFGALEYELLGLGDRDTLKAGDFTLQPTGIHPHRYFYLPHPNNPGEYFLVEARSDKGYDSQIGGDGLLIYHIDRSAYTAGYSDYYAMTLRAYQRWERNEVNTRPDRQCAYLLEAVENADTVQQVFLPYGEVTTVRADGTPALKFRNGTMPNLAITDIRREADGAVSFRVITPISAGSTAAFQNTAIMNWTIDPYVISEGVDSCTVTFSMRNSSATVKTQLPDENGHILLNMSGLKAGTSYTTFTRVYTSKATYTLQGELRTIPSDARVAAPFILLTSEARRKDGSFITGRSFPLYVYNSTDAESIEWFFDGEPVRLDSNGFFTVSGSGELRAVLHYADGSEYVIVKQISASQ